MKNFRLTVHVANQPKVDTRAPKAIVRKGKQKSAVDLARENAKKDREGTQEQSSKGRYKLYNTLSFYCKDMEEVHKKLADVRAKYDIQLGNDHNKKDKYGKELYNVSFVK
tara:strand:+ start:505 stop:834 length:330 start_codon:yes stop_codon:yes gene_type:complete